MFRLLRIAGAIIVWVLVASRSGSAHPLGNFTINHLSEIGVRSGAIDVKYVLDEAEIPTYQDMRERSADGRLDAAGIAAWARDEAKLVAPQLALTVDGVATPLDVVSAKGRTNPGAGGLPTLYMTAAFHAPLAPGAHHIAYVDGTFAGRIGWKDVIVLPQTEPTRELTAYPGALIGSPPDRTSVTADLSAAGRVVAVAAVAPVADVEAPPSVPSAARSNQLSDLLTKHDDWKLVVFALAFAIFLGGLHALEPGHGKTLLAVSLVGARATVSQAAILAGSLTVAHTIGVIGLGVLIELFKGAFVPERIYPWITLLSGVAIAVIGARSIQRQVLAVRSFEHEHGHAHGGAHPHAHPHVHALGEQHHDVSDAAVAQRAFAALHASGATHDHGSGAHTHGPGGHSHGDLDDEAHARAHQIPGTAPLKFGPTVWAAMSGGIAPCPAALVTLLAAIALNQVAYGIVLIVAFSFGLAGTLTGLGIAVVRGAAFLQRRKGFDRFIKYGPLVSALAIGTIGAVMVGQGFAEQGIRVSALLVTIVTGLGIAGFAFSPSPGTKDGQRMTPGPLTINTLAVFLIGLRHGADPDHIAAIDNMTRGSYAKQPVLSRFVGTLFASGHSIMVLSIAMLVGLLGANFTVFHDQIETAGTWISIAVLVLIGIMNLRQLASGSTEMTGYRTRLMPKSLLSGKNAFTALLVGLLFGFGFETSSQVAAAALALDSGAGWLGGLAIGAVFSLGMILTDTLDSVIVHRLVSDRASVLPLTKRIWIVSVTIVAFLVAGYELAQVLGWQSPVHDIVVTGVIVGALLAVFAYVFIATRTGVGATRSNRSLPEGDNL